MINSDWDTLQHDDINIYASNITNQLLKISGKHIPNKTKYNLPNIN